MKKLKDQTILILDCKKIKDHKIFNPNANLIAINSDIDKAFQSIHQKIMTKIKKLCQ